MIPNLFMESKVFRFAPRPLWNTGVFILKNEKIK
jgi:hypothetical protein